MKLSGIAAVFAAALSVCACATPYGASDISASQVDPATLQIISRPNAHTASETIQRYVLMRAAEETSRRGFDLFLMLPSPEAEVLGKATAESSSHATTISSGKGGEKVLVMMFRGERPSNAPANLYRATDVLATPHADR
jgi:hypothetical protein